MGPLHGVPTLLKDNHDTRDMPTTAGSVALADSEPPRDAFVVERLREAGAVVVGKANLQELSFGVDTVSSLGGETRNAYDLDRRPSGSSGGTAAAVAASLATVGTGSDTCSSVRSPPAFNDLVGVRPTRGLVSRTGIVPLSGTQDTAGPVARTVADAARTLEAVAGYDPEGPVTARGVGRVPDDGYVAHLDADGLDGARVGVVRDLFGLRDGENGSEADAAAVTRVVDAALDEMAEVYATGELAPSVAERFEGSGILDVDADSVGRNADYLRRLRRREDLRDAVLAAMADDDLDALVYPPSRVPPVAIPDHQPFAGMNCELAAHTGLPAVVLPAGFTDDGLPVGVELLGRAFAEPRLFELGYGFESVTDHRRPPERFGPLAE